MPVLSANFQKAYQLLNPAQKLAVDEIDGPVMVIAGPGTGKTQVLTTRIANILRQTDTEPRNILALTYTESAATNMRERLVKMIGKEGHYVQISTFHAFCSEVISTHSEYFSLSQEAQPLTELERFEILTSIIDQLDLTTLKPLNDPYHHLKDISGRISELKRENISPEQLLDLVEIEEQRLEDDLKALEKRNLQKKIEKNRELAQVYLSYQKLLSQKQRYDFEDMIRFVIEAFDSNDELLLEYQENLHYFLIDEYQDTNAAQNQIIDKLASYWEDKPNVFVVGDPNQSIFRFQGASVENVLAFIDKYPLAKVITLTTGYRCPQPIYDLAHQLIRQNNLTQAQDLTPNLNPIRLAVLKELDKKLVGKKVTDKIVELNIAPSRTAEIIQIAEKIKDLNLNKKVRLQDIAILYHDNADAEIIKEVLAKWNLDFNVQSTDDVLANEHIRQLLEFFRIINHINDDDRELNVFQVLSYKWLKTDKLKLMKLAKIATLQSLSLFECLDHGYTQITTEAKKYDLSEEDFQELQQLLEKLRNYKVEDLNLTFSEWFEFIINESGFLKYVSELDNSLEIILNLKTLFDQIKNLNQLNHDLKLDNFLSALDLMTNYHLTIKAETIKLKDDAVHLSTVHKAKGQEWEHVFVVGLEDKKWGNRRKKSSIDLPEGVVKNISLEKKDRDEDDRRLFYVALTRARNCLYLSLAKTYMSNNQEKSRPQSIFISEIENPSHIKTNDEVSVSDELLAKLVQIPEKNLNHDQKLKDFFGAIVKNYQLTVSDLKIYLHDRQEFIEKVLLRLPTAKKPFFAFGTAIHAALEFMYAEYKKTQHFPTLQAVQENFRYHLSKEVLSSAEFSRRLKNGNEVLKKYYEENSTKEFSIWGLERKFGGFKNPIVLEDNYLIAGRVDRLDQIDEKTKQVKVIDYKTGKQKTANEIDGKVGLKDCSERELSLPESIRGHYKRQLLFYKLLVENDKNLNLTVTHGEFEFVEPKENGKLVNRLFELKDEDVAELRKLIIQVLDEIKNLEFLNESSQ